MRSVYRRVIVVAVAIAAGMGTTASAFAANCCASHGASAKQAHTPAEVSAGHADHERSGAVAAQAEAKVKTTGAVTVTGRNYCIGCSVATKDSAMAECDRNGHKMVVKVKEARDADDKEVPELKGRVLRYTDNETAKTLADKVHYGKLVTLSGSLSEDGRKLTVTKIASNWTCVMHPEIRQAAPGKCPKCGMNLTPVASDSAHEETQAAPKQSEPKSTQSQLRKPAGNPAAKPVAGGSGHADHKH